MWTHNPRTDNRTTSPTPQPIVPPGMPNYTTLPVGDRRFPHYDLIGPSAQGVCPAGILRSPAEERRLFADDRHLRSEDDVVCELYARGLVERTRDWVRPGPG